MKEDFLHYIWKYQKIDSLTLVTCQNETLEIAHCGTHNHASGPDFFNAQVIINNQKWAGNVEIHVLASDWYLHQHELNSNYDTVILHVVWEYDTPVLRKDQSEIPVLELKRYVNQKLLTAFNRLKHNTSWINCEFGINQVHSFLMSNWLERLYFERLEMKVQPILDLLIENNNDWEATLFCFLAKNFGLNINGDAFFQMALHLPFSVIKKERFDVNYLEALFFGTLNMFPEQPLDQHTIALKDLYNYLSIKYNLKKNDNARVEFFRLRPDNFPTVRMAQLAMLYHKNNNLFSQLMQEHSINKLIKIFDVSVAPYWDEHYAFDKKSKKKNKSLSKTFIYLLIINTIIPIKFAYSKVYGQDNFENIIDLTTKLNPENNSIISNFKNLGLQINNALDSQAMLQLYKYYCSQNKCLQCTVGIELLKSE